MSPDPSARKVGGKLRPAVQVPAVRLHEELLLPVRTTTARNHPARHPAGRTSIDPSPCVPTQRHEEPRRRPALTRVMVKHPPPGGDHSHPAAASLQVGYVARHVGQPGTQCARAGLMPRWRRTATQRKGPPRPMLALPRALIRISSARTAPTSSSRAGRRLGRGPAPEGAWRGAAAAPAIPTRCAQCSSTAEGLAGRASCVAATGARALPVGPPWDPQPFGSTFRGFGTADRQPLVTCRTLRERPAFQPEPTPLPWAAPCLPGERR